MFLYEITLQYQQITQGFLNHFFIAETIFFGFGITRLFRHSFVKFIQF